MLCKKYFFLLTFYFFIWNYVCYMQFKVFYIITTTITKFMNNQQINFNKFKYYMKILENVVCLFFYLFVIIFLTVYCIPVQYCSSTRQSGMFFLTNFDSTGLKYWSNQLVHTGHQASVLRDPGMLPLNPLLVNFRTS